MTSYGFLWFASVPARGPDHIIGYLSQCPCLASRLCDAAEAGQIMITQRVYADVEDLAEVEPVGDLDLKGFAKPVPTLNLLALKEGAT
jgi:adenylate cyclase